MSCVDRLPLRAAAIAVLCIAWLGSPTSSSAPAPLDVPGRSDQTPWVAASGSFVAVAWGASAAGKADVFLAVSRDGGDTFGQPVQVNRIAGEARLGGELPPRVALVARRESPTPEIVVTWTARGDTTAIKTARSRDGGSTFADPVVMQAPGAIGDRGWPAMTVDHRAAVHAIWLDHRGLAARRAAGAAPAAHTPGVQHDGAAMAQHSGLYYASVGGSRTAERELAKGVCYCCKTALAAGPDGTLFAAWRHVYPGNLRDMAFAISRDGGRTFSASARVHEDRWAVNGCPDDGPALGVDAKGTAHLVWPTVIDGPQPEGAIFYASTRDGRQFTPPVRVPTLGGPKPSHPQIVVDRRGRTFVAWDESLDGRRVAALREITRQPGRSPAFGDIVRLSTDGAAVYPVLAATDAGLVAVWTTGGEDARVERRIIRMP